MRLGNAQAELALDWREFDGVLPGTVIVESLWPASDFLGGVGINALVSDDPVAPAGGAVFHDTAIWVRAEAAEMAMAARVILLGLAAIAWVLVHVGIAGTRLRDRVVARLGEGGFMGAFSILSVLTLVALVFAYRAAPYDPIWVAPGWLGWILVIAMLPASILFVGSVASPNPTAAGGERVTAPRGMTLITRHPMLWGFAIWAGVHVLGNGDLASLLFFGAFLATALAGMPSIDAKLARRDPGRWAGIAAATSIISRRGAVVRAGR